MTPTWKTRIVRAMLRVLHRRSTAPASDVTDGAPVLAPGVDVGALYNPNSDTIASSPYSSQCPHSVADYGRLGVRGSQACHATAALRLIFIARTSDGLPALSQSFRKSSILYNYITVLVRGDISG